MIKPNSKEHCGIWQLGKLLIDTVDDPHFPVMAETRSAGIKLVRMLAQETHGLHAPTRAAMEEHRIVPGARKARCVCGMLTLTEGAVQE